MTGSPATGRAYIDWNGVVIAIPESPSLPAGIENSHSAERRSTRMFGSPASNAMHFIRPLRAAGLVFSGIALVTMTRAAQPISNAGVVGRAGTAQDCQPFPLGLQGFGKSVLGSQQRAEMQMGNAGTFNIGGAVMQNLWSAL